MGLFADHEPRRGPAVPIPPPLDGLVARPATRADVPALAALRVARGDATREEALEWFAERVADSERDHTLVLAAEADRLVVAYGSVEALVPPSAPAGWYLAGLVVAAAVRRRGIGLRLTQDRLAWVAAHARRAFCFANAPGAEPGTAFATRRGVNHRAAPRTWMG